MTKQAQDEVDKILDDLGYQRNHKGIPSTIEELTEFYIKAKGKVINIDKLYKVKKDLLNELEQFEKVRVALAGSDLDMKIESKSEQIKNLRKDLKKIEHYQIKNK